MRGIAFLVATSFALGSVARAAELDVYAVRARLRTIEYRSCGTGGPGAVDITFAPSGEATNTEVHDGHWTDRAIACVEARFSAARIEPFDGPARTVRYQVKLPPDPPTAWEVLRTPSKEETYRGRPLGPAYHLESRPRAGLMIAGGALMGAGLLAMIAAGKSGSSSGSGDFKSDLKTSIDRDVLFLGGALLVVGGGVMLGVGSITRDVPVKNRPMVLTVTARF